MFTGLIETMGVITQAEPMDTGYVGGAGFSMTIGNAALVLEDCHLGDSIAVNGTCLTVTAFEKDWFKVGISPETLRKTNLGLLKVGAQVNLERAMSASTRFGGHFVQGHVDATVSIHSIVQDPPNSVIYTFHASREWLNYIVPKGYVCLDGTSLTVINVDLDKCLFSIMLIAYTQERVIMTKKQVGDLVNLEVDQMGKYVEQQIINMFQQENGPLMALLEKTVHRLTLPKQ